MEYILSTPHLSCAIGAIPTNLLIKTNIMPSILKSTRVLKPSNSTELTDELFGELSVTQQLLAKIGEAVKVDVMISSFEDRKYVSRESILAIHDALFA